MHWAFAFLLVTCMALHAHGCANITGPNGHYCACTAGNCQPLARQPIEAGKVNAYFSTGDGKRFEFTQQPLSVPGSAALERASSSSASSSQSIDITVHVDKRRQSIDGFGGAMTDAAAINILSLPVNLQDQIIRDYMSNDGLQYSICRVPVAGSDFSNHTYTYNEVDGDFEQTHFALTVEDTEMKIPLLKKMKELYPELKLFGSAWSGPKWMKTNGAHDGEGGLKGRPGGPYYKSWAKYLVKFLKEYEKVGLPFWGLTTENEPINGFVPNFHFNAMAFTAAEIRDFVKLDLGPALEEAGLPADKFKVLIIDDQLLLLPNWARIILTDEAASKYVGGIAFHWYFNKYMYMEDSVLDLLHEKYPDKILISTEACHEKPKSSPTGVFLGSWPRAEDYARDIIEDLNHWTTGWVDWNLALDEQGGPNWIENFVDAPIIVDAVNQRYFRQPIFYAMSHFSKFLPPGSRNLQHKQSSNSVAARQVRSTAFERPDGEMVLVVLNEADQAFNVHVNASAKGSFTYNVPAKSLFTFNWK